MASSLARSGLTRTCNKRRGIGISNLAFDRGKIGPRGEPRKSCNLRDLSEFGMACLRGFEPPTFGSKGDLAANANG